MLIQQSSSITKPKGFSLEDPAIRCGVFSYILSFGILMTMKKILLTIFAILFVPFLGLPSVYDRWLLAVLILLLAAFVFIFYKKKDEPKLEETPKKETKTKTNKADKNEKESPEEKEEELLLSKKDMEEIQDAVEKTKNK